MEEKLKSILDEKDLKEEIRKAKHKMDLQLYKVEYVDELENNFKSITTGEYINLVSEMRLSCIRVIDDKIVFINKNNNKKQSSKQGKYKVYIPLDVPNNLLTTFIEDDKDKKYDEFSNILKDVAIIFYILSAIFIIIGMALAIEEGGFIFITIFIATSGIVFMGLILHALSHILINLVNINRKLKK